MKRNRVIIIILAVVTAIVFAGAFLSASADNIKGEKKINIDVFAPEKGDMAGLGNRAFLVDMSVEFRGFNLTQTGFTAPQLTGPGAHNDTAPFPGTFSPGKDDRFPGLIVLLSGATINAPFSGPGTNLANLFNIVTVTDRQTIGNAGEHGRGIEKGGLCMDCPVTETWATWIVGAPAFGTGNSTLLVAIADDKNRDGIFNDAPNSVPDADGDRDVDKDDLEASGVSSGIVEVEFFINPNS